METNNIAVTWRGVKYVLEMNSGATLSELGLELQKLTDVKGDTMRLIVPQLSTKSSKLFLPFSKKHCNLSLKEASILKGNSLMMMGVPEREVDEIIQSSKAGLTIAGFEEEERRLRQRMDRSTGPIKLPQGPYIFCDFRTLHIPGLQLNPPPSEALKRMHMLAADPGIVAIMNKHRWRVGIMTEMAPEGYVGVSPMCVLGFNLNHGEEISLRLCTDDLKGFRKYESIKKTLLHELTHMVHSEHDNKFLALQSQLNHEASTLDWTKSKSHSLSNSSSSSAYEEENFMDVQEHSSTGHILGGNSLPKPIDARATSVAAAFRRLATTSLSLSNLNEEEPDRDATIGKENIDELDDGANAHDKHDHIDSFPNINELDDGAYAHEKHDHVDSDDMKIEAIFPEPDPDATIVEGDETKDSDPVDLPNDSSLTPPTEELNPDNYEELKRIQDPVTIFCTRIQSFIKMLKSEVLCNTLGLPLRQEEKSCSFYMRTGHCKFGAACKFHHPEPASVGTFLPVYGTSGSSVVQFSGPSLVGGVPPAWSLEKLPYTPGPPLQGFQNYAPVILPSQGILSSNGWNTYLGCLNPSSSVPALGSDLGYYKNVAESGSSSMNLLSSTVNFYLPERPDKPECRNYLSTGNCKYGSGCKYHHPRDRAHQWATNTLGPLGLPMRPGQAVCSYYSLYGLCKYGPSCKFDHPLVGYYSYNYVSSHPNLPSTVDGLQNHMNLPSSSVVYSSDTSSPTSKSSSNKLSISLSQKKLNEVSDERTIAKTPPHEEDSSEMNGLSSSTSLEVDVQQKDKTV